MAELADLPLSDRIFVRTYPWRRIDPVPWAPLRRPLSVCRVAIVSSAGMVLPDQTPFDPGIKGGDWSFRVVPNETDPSVLRDTHRSRSFDHAGIARDPDLAFPLTRLRELVRERRVGEAAPRHLSFMGSISAPGRLVRDSAPEAAGLLSADGVDVAILVPV